MTDDNYDTFKGEGYTLKREAVISNPGRYVIPLEDAEAYVEWLRMPRPPEIGDTVLALMGGMKDSVGDIVGIIGKQLWIHFTDSHGLDRYETLHLSQVRRVQLREWAAEPKATT